MSQLPSDHDDPKIAAGLAVIRQLDEKLREVWLKVGTTTSDPPISMIYQTLYSHDVTRNVQKL